MKEEEKAACQPKGRRIVSKTPRDASAYKGHRLLKKTAAGSTNYGSIEPKAPTPEVDRCKEVCQASVVELTAEQKQRIADNRNKAIQLREDMRKQRNVEWVRSIPLVISK